jgi:hypothetical protein
MTTPEQEYPIPWPYKNKESAFAHAEGLLKQVETFERLGLEGAAESRAAWEKKYGEIYRSVKGDDSESDPESSSGR